MGSIVLVYAVGYLIDENQQHNYFIGGILPYIGWKTTRYGPYDFRAFWLAWFRRGICINGTLIPRK